MLAAKLLLLTGVLLLGDLDSMRKFILFLLPGLGDVIMFLPTLRELFKAFPEATFDCLVMFHSTEQILKQFQPRIRRVIYADFMNMSKISAGFFALSLRKNEYDVSITSYPANRPEYNILSFLVGAKIRIAHKYKHLSFVNLPFLNNRLVEQTEQEHNVEENIKLLKPLGVDIPKPEHPAEEFPLFLPLSDEHLQFAEDYVKEKGLDNYQFLIGIHAFCSPFKNQDKRCWSANNFSRLIDKLGEEYPESRVLLFGGPQDEEVNERIYNTASHNPLIVKNLGILQVAALIKKCRIFISNDSGLMHTAAAVQVPIVGIFGPTNPVFVHPWGVKHRIVRQDLPCSPCFYYSQKPLTCRREERDFLCIKGINIDMVFEATRDLLCEIKA